jgi:hypothetical protein
MRRSKRFRLFALFRKEILGDYRVSGIEVAPRYQIP